ncbi:MAG: sulfite exporter TauE/SafE family protein [Puniceicoccaceae bacterium]
MNSSNPEQNSPTNLPQAEDLPPSESPQAFPDRPTDPLETASQTPGRRRRVRKRRLSDRRKRPTNLERSARAKRNAKRAYLILALFFVLLPVFLLSRIPALQAAYESPDYLVEQVSLPVGLAQGKSILGQKDDIDIVGAAISPLPALFFSPIGRGSSLSSLQASGSFLAALFTLPPILALLFFQSRRSRENNLRFIGLAVGIVFALIPLFLLPDLRSAMLLPGPYPIAMACLLGIALLSSYERSRAHWYFSNLAGILLALAFWCEPASAMAYFGIGGFFLYHQRLGDLRRFTISFLVFSIVLGLVLGIIFGFRSLWFNLVVIPLHTGFTNWSPEPQSLDGLFSGLMAAVKTVATGWFWVAPLAIFLVFATRKQRQSSHKKKDRLTSGRLVIVLVLISLSIATIAPLAITRAGGHPQVCALFSFPIFIALGVFAQSRILHHPPKRRLSRNFIGIAAFLGIVLPIGYLGFQQLSNEAPIAPEHEAAVLELKSRSGWYFAPYHPLAHLLAEKKLFINAVAMDRYRLVSGNPISVSIRQSVPLTRRRILLPENQENRASLNFIISSFPYHNELHQTAPQQSTIPILEYYEIPEDDFELLMRRS